MPLEQLWAGWRDAYVQDATSKERRGEDEGCVFCRIAASGDPSAENGIVFRDDLTLAVLNLFPYASGHLLILPTRHVGVLADLAEDESAAVWRTGRLAVSAIEAAYEPDGVNLGANLGRAAGAGIPEHLHLHVLPRWSGDTNFMTSVAQVRVLPESLAASWERLRAAWPIRAGPELSNGK